MTTRIGMWYATGPEDQPYTPGNPAWTELAGIDVTGVTVYPSPYKGKRP